MSQPQKPRPTAKDYDLVTKINSDIKQVPAELHNLIEAPLTFIQKHALWCTIGALIVGNLLGVWLHI